MTTEGWILVADRLELLRTALLGLLSVGLLTVVPADRSRLDRVSTSGAVFTATSADLQFHTLNNYSSLSTAAARSVLFDMVDHDLRLWVNELMRFSTGIHPALVPPPPDMVFEMPPVPIFSRTAAFCQGDEELLKIVEETPQGQRSVGDGGAKRRPHAGPSPAGTIHLQKKRTQPCRVCLCTGKCGWRDCIVLNDSPPADSPSQRWGRGQFGGARVWVVCPGTIRGRRVLGRGSQGERGGVAALARDEDSGSFSRLGRYMWGRLQRQLPVGRPCRRLRVEMGSNYSPSAELRRGC